LVTIHGIGFQQAPRQGGPGYADDLHAALALQLPGLSDDPQRQPWQTAPSVPIYVQSRFPAADGTREQGLARLGRWTDADRTSIDATSALLVTGDSTVAHVALVYSEIEDLGPQPEATAETLLKGLLEHGHYGSVLSTLRTVLIDAKTAWLPPEHDPAKPGGSSLRPRADTGDAHLFPRLWPHHDNPSEPMGILGTIRQVEDDVCGYVCRNDLRERVRSFVRDALLRLIARDDVGSLVLNTHSNGTVIGFDVLRDMPVRSVAKVRTLITAGSPLRKYAELFSWGHEVGSVSAVGQWRNYFDPQDPVADPLAHPIGWTQGQPFDLAKLAQFVAWPPDATTPLAVPIDDLQVDNVHHSSGGGLQAHDYWDNSVDFIPELVKTLSYDGSRL
jgi:hypothetical protein